MLPRRNPCIAPFCPHKTSSSAGGSLTMESTISELAASSRGHRASFAPAATSSSARDAVRFQTVKGKPAFNKFIPMGLPISPKPISPTFVCGPITEFTKTSALSKKHLQRFYSSSEIDCSVFNFSKEGRSSAKKGDEKTEK